MEKLSGAKFKSIAPAALLLGVLLQGCDNSSGKTDAEYLAAAKDFYLKDNYPAGMLELKNALQVNPDNAEARRLLGEVNVKLGAGAAAEKELRRAMELGVALEAVAPSLAEALSQQGKYKELLAEISAEASADPATKAVLLSYRGDAWLARAKPDEASKEYKLAEEVAPKAYQPQLGLAQIVLADNRPDDAMKLADQALELAPDEPRVFAFKASLHELKKEWDKAEAMYTEAISHSKIPTVHYLYRALVRTNLGKLEPASADLAEGKKIAPRHYLASFVDGRLKLFQGKYQEAETALEESLKENPRHILTRYYLAEANLLSNHLEQAESNIRQLLASAPESSPALLLAAAARYRSGDFEGAKQALDPLLRKEPNNVLFLQQMAAIEVARGNSAEGLGYLEKAAKLAPNAASLQARLGMGLLAQGETGKALEIFKKAVELQPDSEQAVLLLILGEIQAKNFAKAVALIDGLEKKHPNDPLPSNLRGLLALAQKDKASARKFYEAAIKVSPGDVKALVNLATFAVAEGRHEEARNYLQQVLKHHPGNVPAQMALALVAARAGDKEQLESDLRRAVELSPQAVGPRVVLARYYLRSGQPKRAEQVLEETRAAHGENPEWLAALAEVQSALGYTTQALNTAKALVKAAPNAPAAHYRLAKVLEETGNIKAMRVELEKSVELSADYLPAQIAMIRLHAAEQNWTEARKAVQALRSSRPADPEVFALAGWLALREGKPEEAIASYRSAFEKAPGAASAVALSNTLWAVNRKDEALTVLRGWVDQNAQDAAGQYALGLLYNRAGQLPEARRHMEQALELNPRNGALLNDLATLVWADDPDKALKYAEEAVKLSPGSPSYRANLGLVLLRKGDTDRARELLREVVRQAPKHPGFRLALAEAEARGGNKAAAIEMLQVLRKTAPQSERQSAEALLKELLGE